MTTNNYHLSPIIPNSARPPFNKKSTKLIWIILKILFCLDIIIHNKEGIHGQSWNNPDPDI